MLLADITAGLPSTEFETVDTTYAICNVDGEIIHCVDGHLSSHAGGPLAQGALHGNNHCLPLA